MRQMGCIWDVWGEYGMNEYIQDVWGEYGKVIEWNKYEMYGMHMGWYGANMSCIEQIWSNFSKDKL